MRCWVLLAGLGLLGCGGVVRSSPGGAGEGGSSGGATTTPGGHPSTEGGRSSSAGQPSIAGQPSTGGQASMPVQCGKVFCPAGAFCCDPVCGLCGSADGACPDIACVMPGRTDCATFQNPPHVLSCAQLVGQATDPNAGGYVSLPTAIITEEVAGALKGGCLERELQSLGNNGPSLAAQAVSWKVSSGNALYDVEALVEGQKLPSLLNEKVSLEYIYKFGGFSPSYRELHLASLASTSHGVWTAEGADLSQLGQLPLLLERGMVACAASEPCGSYERYGLTAMDRATMKLVNVGHGETSTLGPWVVVHGGYAEQTSAGTMCADWFVADIRLAILGRM